MKEKRTEELICIVCPMGCRLRAEVEQANGETPQVLSVSGNSCPRGARYAKEELTAPTRTVTGTVSIEGGLYRRLPVITSAPIPKDKIFDVMEEIHRAHACAPVQIHDIIIPNVCGLGADVLAARTMEQRSSDDESVFPAGSAGGFDHQGV